MPSQSEDPEQIPAWRPLPRSFRLHAAETTPSVLLESARPAPGAKSYLFTRPLAVLEPQDAASLQAAFDLVDAETARGRWIAGYFAYEAGYALEPRLQPMLSAALNAGERLAWIGIFDTVAVFDHAAPGAWEAAPAVAPITDARLALSESHQSYARKVEQVRALIAAGDTYQANLTMQATWPAAGGLALYEAAMAAQPVDYGAWLRLSPGEEIISASPELFFTRNGNAIRTALMKGTAPRGRWLEEDQQQAAWLAHDAKNRAENLMIVDLLRNDLGRICQTGSIHVERLFSVQRLSTVLQMTSEIHGTLRPGLSTAQIFHALFPSGSIVGAPKIRTMQLLHQLEERRRGVYTGAIGFQSPRNPAHSSQAGGHPADPASHESWSVAIRTIRLSNARAQMGVGSGIVWDSSPAAEFAECHSKLAFLHRDNAPFSLIETLLWDQRFERLEAHIARIRRSAAYFGRPFDADAMRSALLHSTRAFSCGGRWRVRLLMNASGAFYVATTQLHEEPHRPLRLLLKNTRVDPADPFLFHKTTRRKLYEDALAQAQALGCADALFLNLHGEVTEGAIHNLFLERDGSTLTPPIACGLLPGVFRAEWIRSQSAMERSLTLDDLRQAQSITVTNSVRGARPVSELLLEDHAGRVFSFWSSPAAPFRESSTPA